jgi:hypothetical protein
MNKGLMITRIMGTVEQSVPNILGRVLPKRVKRMIFVSSFIAHIQNCRQSNSNKTLLSKLNLLMQLSADDKALDLPMRLHNRIWGNIHVEEILRYKNLEITSIDEIVHMEFATPQIRTISEEIVKATPEWLKYDSNTKMRADLIKLFKNLGELLQPQKLSMA